jgi:glucan phosphoethanolaminetransferase (alkaline phosphatase superfamily)
LDIKKFWGSRRKRARRAVASAMTVSILVLICYALFAFVFGIAITQVKLIGNTISPGSENTGDGVIFTDILNYSGIIAVVAAFLLIVILAQRRQEF